MAKAHKPMSLKMFCEILPKVELHAHLNGSLSGATLAELGCVQRSIAQYMKLTEREHLSKISTLQKKTTRAFDECFELFKIAHDATRTPEAVYIATRGVINDFATDNVIYLELRTTARSEENMTKEEYVEAVVKAIRENKRHTIVKLILSINRGHDKNESQHSFEVILKMKRKYPNIIKGIDLSGDPSVGRFEREIFKAAREDGLFTTIHCAELKNDEEVKDILNFRPDRIGHATFLHPLYGGCQENWELYCEKRIPVECCITSNVICATALGYPNHHIREWVHEDLPFCICTDDKGVFNTSLSEEYECVAAFYNLSKRDVLKVSLNAVDYSFASDEEKLFLKDKLTDWKDIFFPK